MSSYQAKRDSGFFESEDFSDIKYSDSIITTTTTDAFTTSITVTISSVANPSVANPITNPTPFSSYFGLYEIKLTKKNFDKLSSSHYWTNEPLENILPSKQITINTDNSNNTTKSNNNNDSNSNIKTFKNNNKSKIEEERIIPFSNYLSLTNRQPTEKFDISDHYWTNLPLEATLPSKSKCNNIKNKKNSSFTPSSISLNLFTEYENMMNKNIK